jgi:hypothetical protein
VYGIGIGKAFERDAVGFARGGVGGVGCKRSGEKSRAKHGREEADH